MNVTEAEAKQWAKNLGVSLDELPTAKRPPAPPQNQPSPSKVEPQQTETLARCLNVMPADYRDRMNGLERKYAAYLDGLKASGEVVLWLFECFKLRLADNTFYTCDFFVMLPDGVAEFHETKGWWRDDARIKFKVALRQYPFRFAGVKFVKGRWRYEYLGPPGPFAD